MFGDRIPPTASLSAGSNRGRESFSSEASALVTDLAYAIPPPLLHYPFLLTPYILNQ